MKIIKVAKAEKDFIQDNQEYALKVTAEIIEDGEVVEIKYFHYPFSATSQEIIDDLKKVLQTTIEDEERAIKNVDFELAQKQADDTVSELEGLEIK